LKKVNELQSIAPVDIIAAKSVEGQEVITVNLAYAGFAFGN